MTLKFTDRPYGGQTSGDNYLARFPQGSRPISEASGVTAEWVFENSGQRYWAMPHRNGWEELGPHKDWRDGTISWRSTGKQITPVRYMPRGK
jgi:hypothetical protein